MRGPASGTPWCPDPSTALGAGRQCLEEWDGNDALVARFTYAPGHPPYGGPIRPKRAEHGLLLGRPALAGGGALI